MRSTNPQILKNQILRCVTQSESTRVDRDRNPGSSPRARELDRAHIFYSLDGVVGRSASCNVISGSLVRSSWKSFQEKN